MGDIRQARLSWHGVDFLIAPRNRPHVGGDYALSVAIRNRAFRLT